MEVLLIRHGEPGSVDPARAGVAATDPPLSDCGRRQAALLAEWIGDEAIDAVCTSPMQRARETAEPLAHATGAELEVVPGLAELNTGEAAYVKVEDLWRTDQARMRALAEGRWADLGLSETYARFSETVLTTFEELIGGNPGRRIAAICHGGVINTIVSNVLGMSRQMFFEPGYTSVTRVAAARTGERTLLSLNETAHLRACRAR